MAEQLRHKLKEVTGVDLYESDYLINLLKAKAALDENDFKTVLEALLDNQIQIVTKSHGIDIPKITRILNTPVYMNGPLIRNYIKFNY